jgi:rubrerythrin
MTLQEAIGTALDYEVKVRDHYLEGAKVLEDPKGKALFDLLGKEEQGHVDYLEHCLAEWKETGKVGSAKPVESLLPKGVAWIDQAKKEASAAPGQARRLRHRARVGQSSPCSTRRRPAASTGPWSPPSRRASGSCSPRS